MLKKSVSLMTVIMLMCPLPVLGPARPMLQPGTGLGPGFPSRHGAEQSWAERGEVLQECPGSQVHTRHQPHFIMAPIWPHHITPPGTRQRRGSWCFYFHHGHLQPHSGGRRDQELELETKLREVRSFGIKTFLLVESAY